MPRNTGCHKSRLPLLWMQLAFLSFNWQPACLSLKSRAMKFTLENGLAKASAPFESEASPGAHPSFHKYLISNVSLSNSWPNSQCLLKGAEQLYLLMPIASNRNQHPPTPVSVAKYCLNNYEVLIRWYALVAHLYNTTWLVYSKWGGMVTLQKRLLPAAGE